MIGATTLGWMDFMCHYGVKNGENFYQSWAVAHWDNTLAQSGSNRPISIALCNKL
jgi:hypothetical protein